MLKTRLPINTFLSIRKCFFLVTVLLGVFIISACDKDDPEPDPDPIASFQFAIDDTDFLKVNFSNFSLNATSYMWDFGDNNSSTEEAPSHTYAAGGTYTVTLTATNSTTSHEISKEVTVVDPNQAIKGLTGETSKTWKLLREATDVEFPLSVGPADRSQIWWAYGREDHIGSRPCLMEEEYIFHLDGTYEYDAKGAVFADYGIWNGDVVGACVDETDASVMIGANGDDLSAWGSGSFTFDYDASAATLTVNGLGAHVGLPKVATNDEVGTPQSSVTYKVVSLETDGPTDKLVLETTLATAGGYWQFVLVSYDNPADEPDLPGAPPTTSFAYAIEGSSVGFNNTSVNADTYSWDFGDGNTSTEENPIHTYANDGNYTVKLTATNAFGSSESTANIVISSSVFSAQNFHGGGSKTWKLNPEEGALAVGPAKGSGEWFATTLDDVNARACTFDDTYTFTSDGVFTYATNGDLWAEAYMGIDPPGCIAEADLPAAAAAWGSGTHAFEVTEASGDQPATVTVTGTGAFIALPKAYNGGEYAEGPPTADAAVTYEVMSYVNDGSKEILVLTIDINGQGSAFWTYTLIAE